MLRSAASHGDRFLTYAAQSGAFHPRFGLDLSSKFLLLTRIRFRLLPLLALLFMALGSPY
jgi:hypothetical protein